MAHAALEIRKASSVFNAASVVAHLSEGAVELRFTALAASDAGAVVADFACFALVVFGAFAGTARAAPEFTTLGDFATLAGALSILATGASWKIGAFILCGVTKLIDGAIAQPFTALRRCGARVVGRWSSIAPTGSRTVAGPVA